VAVGDGAKFPALAAGDWFYLTLEEVAPAVPAFPLREIVKVTARTGDTMTITRAQEGTTARAWLAGDKVEQRLTKQSLEDLRSQWLVGGTMTGNLNVPSLNNGQLAGLRNKVINGAFQVWQRGNGPHTAYAKCADMWDFTYDGTGGTRSLTRAQHNPGQEIEDEANYAVFAQSAAGTATWNGLEVNIEDVRTMNGKTVTLSFWAKADADRTMDWFARQIFGTGGSAAVSSGNTSFNLTTSWVKYTHTFTLPSVAGKTIGTGINKLLLLFMPPLTAFTINIANVQLELGSVATQFENRSLGLELQLCQRYYVKMDYPRFSMDGVICSEIYGPPIAFPVTMRIFPQITLPPASGQGRTSGGGTNTPTVWQSGGSSPNMFCIRMSLASAVGYQSGTVTATAEI
jgi:hypothetical protein